MSTGQTEVLVTSGATEALGDCLFGLIEPGDEVVLIEPLYDFYLPIVRRAGGIPKLVRLEPPTWRLPRDELAAAFSRRTKADPVQHADESLLGKVFIATSWSSSPVFASSTTPMPCATRSTSTSCSTTAAPVDHDACRACASALLRIGSAGKTFSLTGLEGRLRHGRAGIDEAHRQDAPVHDLHHAAQPATGGGDGPAFGRTITSPPWRPTCSASATAWATPCRTSASRCCRPTAPTSSRPTSGLSASTAPTRTSVATSPSRRVSRPFR